MNWWQLVLAILGGVFLFCVAVVVVVVGAARLAYRWENPNHHVDRKDGER
jgi:hypothetical protein